MKKLISIVVAIIGMMVFSVSAMAVCKHIEYAEIQGMSDKESLREYCIDVSEVAYNEKRINTLLDYSKKLLAIPGGLGLDNVEQNEKEMSIITSENMTCYDEKDRILKRLGQFKIDKAKAEASCGSN